jgi:hypothetical protein
MVSDSYKSLDNNPDVILTVIEHKLALFDLNK